MKINYYENSKTTYDKKAKIYDDTTPGKFTLPIKKYLIKEIELKDNSTILDVACGNGYLLNELVKGNIKGYGIDIAPEMIKVCQEKYQHINFKVGNSSNLVFKDNKFDIVTVSAAFHHFPEPEKFIKEVKRVLKKDGKIYIAEIYVFPVLRHFINLILPLFPRGDYKLYTLKDIIKLYEQEGLKVDKIFKKGYTEIISAKK